MLDALSDCAIVGRQSIRDRDLAVAGYELLTSIGDPSHPGGESAGGSDAVSLSVEAGIATETGLNLLVGDTVAYFPAVRSLIAGETELTAPMGRVVLELDESWNAYPDVVAGCQKLVAQGARIALVDFPWHAPDENLLATASLVKIDTATLPAAELPPLIDYLRTFDVQVLAGRIDSPEQLAQMQVLDVDYFQGYALQQIPAGPPREPGPHEMTLARMSSSLLHNPLDFEEIEEMLRTEPGLTYQIIELASIGKLRETARKVTSLRRALVLVGSWRIQNWMMMLLAQPRKQRPTGSITGVLARARACEMLAQSLGRAESRLAFTGGMISAFDELTQVARTELEQTLALADDLRDAAFGDETPLGRIVTDVAERQQGRRQPRELSGHPIGCIDEALSAGYAWAVEAGQALA